jgi:two-component system, NarL family, nitrate/nitrite response regulator NarL
MTDVFVVAPIRVHRESLTAVLETAESLRVVGNAATLDEALPKLQDPLDPVVALVDGALLADLILAAPLASEPGLKLVAVGVPEGEAVAWIEAGASGFVPPDGSLDDVIDAVERVADDQLAASLKVAAQLANRVRRLVAESPDEMPDPRLTSREKEILHLLTDGLSNKQIARHLSIQVQTVKNHVHSVLMKLGVSRRAEAAAHMRQHRHHFSFH